MHKDSQEDYGSLSSLFARIGCSKAKKPKNDMHTCQAALLTVFKGHIVTAGCKEIDIAGNIIIAYTSTDNIICTSTYTRTR